MSFKRKLRRAHRYSTTASTHAKAVREWCEARTPDELQKDADGCKRTGLDFYGLQVAMALHCRVEETSAKMRAMAAVTLAQRAAFGEVIVASILKEFAFKDWKAFSLSLVREGT